MRIKAMTASFGKLRGARLELKDGLNLIEAGNESGKSTWCAFLRAMLYGIPTRERDRQGYLAEKNRYQPWDGGALEGVVELTWRGKDITIRRGPKGNTPFGSFSAVYSGTGEAVPGLTGDNCGETLLGVSREVYERSAFVGQGGAAIGADAELERRIAALVSSGEEDVSFTETEGRLKEWLRRRKFNKSGLIPKLENELAVLNDTLARQERAHGQAEEARREAEQLTARRNTLSTALEAYRRAENRERYEKHQAAQSALQAAQAELEAVESTAGKMPESAVLRGAQGDLAYYNTLEANRRLAESQLPAAKAEADEARERAVDDCFPDMSPDEAWQKASADRDRTAAKPPRNPYFIGSVVLLAAAGLWLAFTVFWVYQGNPLESWMYWVLVIAAGLILAMNTMGSNRVKAWRTETNEILEKYGAQYPDDILARANAYREKCVEAQEAARKAEAVEQSATQLEKQKAELLSGLLEIVHSFEPNVTDLFGVSAAISKGLSIQEKLTAARVRLEGARALADSLPKPERTIEGGADLPFPAEEFPPERLAAELAAVEGELARRKNDLALATGELNTLGDSALFETQREACREELKRRNEEYSALTIALEALGAANSTLQARFSPVLNAKAGEILSALTGGKYSAIGLNRQFEAEAQETGSTLPRSTLFLSQGTAEQVYLAVRLAVCGMALPADDPAPLVLDDALDAFDDGRMALALNYLLKLGEERQVLCFSCHSREGEYLKGKACNQITLGV